VELINENMFPWMSLVRGKRCYEKENTCFFNKECLATFYKWRIRDLNGVENI